MRDVTKLPWLVVSPVLGVVATFYLNVEAVRYAQREKYSTWIVVHRDQYLSKRELDNA